MIARRMLFIAALVGFAARVSAQTVDQGVGGASPWRVSFANVTASGSITANGQSVCVTPQAGASSLGFAFSNTWTGTLAVEGRVNASGFTSIIPGGLGASSITFNVTYQLAIGAYAEICVRSTAWTSGTADITLITSLAATPHTYIENVGSITNPVTVTPQGGAMNVQVTNTPNISTILNSVSVLVADGDDLTLGSYADAAVGDSEATVNSHLRYIAKTLGVTGIVVSNTLTDAQLRAAPVGVLVTDGNLVTMGAKADAKSTATDTTPISLMQVFKEISFMEQNPASRAVTNTGTFATQSTITAASGSIQANAFAAGAYPAGSVSDGAIVTLGLKDDARSTATDVTAISLMQVFKEISFMEQNPASRAVTNAGTFPVQSTLQAGSAIAGKFGIDQTTPGTTNRVTIGADTIAALTSITNPVTVAQPTAANLNVTEPSAAAIKAAVETIDNFISGSRGLVTEDNSAAIKTAVELIDNFISGARGLVTEDNSAGIKAGTDKIPSQGQALSSASMPVVLPAAQITTLTPPAAITGFATSANQTTELASLSSIDGKTPALGQALAAASTPVVLTAAQVTTLTPPAAIAGYALEAGNLATIVTNTTAIATAARQDTGNASLATIAGAVDTPGTSAPSSVVVMGGMDGTGQTQPIRTNSVGALAVVMTAGPSLLQPCNPVRRTNCQPKGY